MSRRERALGCIAAGRLLKVCWYGCVIEMSPTLPFFFEGNKILASAQVSMQRLCKLEVWALLPQALSVKLNFHFHFDLVLFFKYSQSSANKQVAHTKKVYSSGQKNKRGDKEKTKKAESKIWFWSTSSQVRGRSLRWKWRSPRNPSWSKPFLRTPWFVCFYFWTFSFVCLIFLIFSFVCPFVCFCL